MIDEIPDHLAAREGANMPKLCFAPSAPKMPLRLISALLLLILLPMPSPAQDLPAITITPDRGEVESALLTIAFTDLEADTRYRVEFIFDGQVVFASEETSDAAGDIIYPVASTEGDLPGAYTVRLLREGAVVASAEFELTPRAQQAAATVTVSPPKAPIGTLHRVTIADLAPGQAYTVEITADETRQVVYSRSRSSDDNGLIAFDLFGDASDAPGPQRIAVYDAREMLIAEGEFIMEAPRAGTLRLAVNPAVAAAGGVVAIDISGTAAFAGVSAQITSADGILIDTVAARASESGEASLAFAAPDNMAQGRYDIWIFVEGQRLAEGTLTIAAPEDLAAPSPDDAEPAATPTEAPAPEPSRRPVASAVISPQAGPIGSTHVIAVRDLAAGEGVQFQVVFAGEVVYAAEKTADDGGNVTLELVTGAGDQPGDYIITVMRQSGNQPSVVLTATTPPAAADPHSATERSADVITSQLRYGAATFNIQGEAGRYLLLTIDSGDFDPAARLFGRDGREIAASDDSMGRESAVIGPVRLPYSGAYQLDVFPSPQSSDESVAGGRFSLAVETVTVAQLDYDRALDFALGPNNPALYYELPVQSGDSLSVIVDSGGSLDTVLQLLASDGAELAFDDDSGAGRDAEISDLVFERAGTAILTVTTYDSQASGSGQLIVKRDPARALEAGAAIVHLNDKAIRDLVVFEAAAAELLVLHLDKLAGDVEDLYVKASVDGMEVMSYMTMGVPDELPLAFVMPMSGRVVVELEKVGVNDGISLSLSLERP